MIRKVAIQMDPFHTLNPATDTTLLLIHEAMRRGYQLYSYAPVHLCLEMGMVMAYVHPVRLDNTSKSGFTSGPAERIWLSEMDVILVRQHPPFNMHYITTTYLL